METEKLAEVTRGSLVESVHRGAVAVVNLQGEIIASAGDPFYLTYFRSAAKPLQALAVMESGAVEEYAITLKEIAIMLSSHSGEPEHGEVVTGILEKLGLSEEYLQCGISAPFHKPSKDALMRKGLEPTALHNCCSGKHAGMLTMARYLNLSLDDYFLPEHPVQQEMLKAVAEMAGLEPEKIPLSVDGCGVPVFALTLDKMAYSYARLAVPETEDLSEVKKTACEAVKAAIINYPYLIAGTERFTTDLLRVTGNKLIAKDGSEAVFCLGVPDKGWGIAIKMEDGNERAMAPVVLSVLEQLELLTAEEKERLAAYRMIVLKNIRGEIVGVIRPDLTLKRTLKEKNSCKKA